MTFTPLNKIVFLEPDTKPTTTAQGIAIPGAEGQIESTGTVIAVAADVTLCRVGDRVSFQGFNTVSIDGKETYVTHENKLIGVQKKVDADAEKSLRTQRGLQQDIVSGTPAEKPGTLVN